VNKPALEAENISVSFGGLRAVNAISCRLFAGETLGIIGPNGAGKTTLLNAISGFVRCHPEGRLRILGVDATFLAPASRSRLGLGRTFQSLEMSHQETVLDNVLVGAHARYPSAAGWSLVGLGGSQQEEARLTDEARHYLDYLQIDAWRAEKVASVPYAVKKRLQICRALMGKPRILMLDEPASGMSPAEKDRLRLAILGLHKQTELSLLLIEHDVGFLTAMCDRLMALNFGSLLAEGTCSAVTRNSAVIEAYLGSEHESAAA
jgi:branched-chain amino acid transport system ATP-binding protein